MSQLIILVSWKQLSWEILAFKDKDDKVTIKQLSMIMEKIFGSSDEFENHETGTDFQSLLWSIKIDKKAYVEIIEKCKLRQLLREANYGNEESMAKLFKMMDKVNFSAH